MRHMLTSQQLRTAARVLNDPVTRDLYDRELRGEKVDWLLATRGSRSGYYDHDRRPSPSRGPRRGDSYRPQRGTYNTSHRIDRYVGQVTYPDSWIAARDGRSWSPPPSRAARPYGPAPRPRSASPKKEAKPGHQQGRASPDYNPYKDRR